MGRAIGFEMLRELRIKNLALMDQVALELGPGLNVLTGETGAGKTILLNALGLILGGRVSSDIIRAGEEEASVEGLFGDLPQALQRKLEEADYAAEEELVVRRVVSRSGKNRVYLGGSLSPLALLSEVGARLIHIYGQHEHHSLLRPEAHLELLDAYGGLEERIAAMKASWQALTASWSRLREARDLCERRRRDEEALRARAQEIAGARLQPGEEDELRAKKNILMHAEKLFQGCREGEEILYEGEDALIGRLGRYAMRLKELAAIDPGLEEGVHLIDSALAQLEEATSTLRRYTSRADFDPAALEQLEDRLAEISRLKRKYNGSVEEILGLKERAEEDLRALARGEEEIPALERSFETARRSAWETAAALSLERKRAAKRLKKEMEREVETLGMPKTLFEVRFLDPEAEADEPPFLIGGRRLGEAGADRVEFYFAPNPGEDLKPLVKIASGGELSRLMLALKSLVLTKGEIPTLLFDEVDAGIGGRVAEMVGKKLKKVAASQQVVCVTHLPQIAALADCHYVVRKETVKGRTSTEVKRLGGEERVTEVARMLGGVKITEQARRHAEEMVMQGGRMKA